MGTDRILDTEWPYDLDPVTVPFKGRTVTVLRRAGLYDDWSDFNRLTELEVRSWWNTGTVTVEDVRVTGNEAIRRHRAEAHLYEGMDAGLREVAAQPWAPHIWHRDPRFAKFIPLGDATVAEIAASDSVADRRWLWRHVTDLQDAVEVQGGLSLLEAVAAYAEAVSGQHDERLRALLARTGLGGEEPISGKDAARLIGVSQQRIYQIVGQFHRRRDGACPPAGIWMPQLDDAGRHGWPEHISTKARKTIRGFLVTD